jgi:hypothetical protein
MIPLAIKTELARIALQKLSGVNADDVAQAVRTIRRASRGVSWLPGLGGLGVGLAVGAAIGVLIAPRSGAETRGALRDLVRARMRRWRKSDSGEQANATSPGTNGVAANA